MSVAFTGKKRSFPLLKRVVIFLLLPLLVALGGVYAWQRQSLPSKQAVVLQAQGGTARITRDAHGVPRIDATSDEAAFYAVGYVQAQDRAWQLELQRRMVRGKLSEVLGRQALQMDIWSRTLDLSGSAASAWASLTPAAQRSLTAYTQGVNAAMNAQRVLPVEFTLLDVKPGRWTETDSLAWIKMFAQSLGGNYANEITRSIAISALPGLPLTPFFPDYQAAPEGAAKPDVRSSAAATAFLDFQDTLQRTWHLGGKNAGSNAWAVAGRLTSDGAALLANDPHLGLQMPSLWYVLDVHAPSLRVTGMSLAGLPVVIFGHNAQIGWGGTNLMADVQDLYLERTDPADSGRYDAGGKWERFVTRTESISVRADAPAAMHSAYEPVKVVLRSTRHGPLVSDYYPLFDQPVSLQWTALAEHDTSYEAFFKLQYARDWDGFNEALSHHVAPTLNMLYADRGGNIGYLAAGRIPVRGQGDGTVPAAGWDERFAWTGTIPFAQVPRIYNPASGYIVSANNRMIDASYPYFISRDWAPPTRARRIEALLADQVRAGKPFAPQDMERIQADVIDQGARDAAQRLTQGDWASSPRQREAVALLRAWDGRMTQDSVAASLFTGWMRHARTQLFSKHLSGYWNRPAQAARLNGLVGRVGPGEVVSILSDPASPWYPRGVGAESLLRSSLDEAAAELERLTGSADMDKWKWGEIHRAAYPHTPLSKAGPLRLVFEQKVPAGGSENTINVAGATFVANEGYLQTLGASFRHIIRLGSGGIDYRYMNSTGQSGDVISQHYADMVAPFGRVEYYGIGESGTKAGK